MLKSKFYVFHALFLAGLLWGEHGGGLMAQLPAEEVTFLPGHISDTVVCRSDPEQSYALYLPSYYNVERKWPVVLVFDPAARGRLAVEHFRFAGEQLGMIILCSNNSSNQSHRGSQKAAEAMFRDVMSRYQADTSAIYVSGFSGGGRFATRLAQENHWVKGLLSCGVGLYHISTTDGELPRELRYYCIMGWRDMNLQEMPATESFLERSGMNYHVQYVDMAHFWPDSAEIFTSMVWMTGRREIFLERQEKLIARMLSRERFADAAQRLSGLERQFPGKDYSTRRMALEKERSCSKQQSQRQKALKKELNLRKLYLEALTEYQKATPLMPDTVHTAHWWKTEIIRLKNWRSSELLERSRMAERLMYLLDVRFNMDMEHFQAIQLWDKALFIADRWAELEPDRLWARWNIALCYVRGGRDEDAIPWIARMLEDGQTSPDWFEDSPEFSPLMPRIDVRQ